MSSIENLNPRKLFELINNFINNSTVDEVLMRRIVSSLFLSLYNYWSVKAYVKYNRRYNVKGRSSPKGDNFPHKWFYKDVLMQGLDEITDLYLYRVWADHYALHPTDVVLDVDGNKVFRVEINVNKLKDLIKSAYRVLDYIEK